MAESDKTGQKKPDPQTEEGNTQIAQKRPCLSSKFAFLAWALGSCLVFRGWWCSSGGISTLVPWLHTMPGGTSTSRFGSKPGTITSHFYSHSGVQN